MIPSLLFYKYEGPISNRIFHNDKISQFIDALCVILCNSKHFKNIFQYQKIPDLHLPASPIQDIHCIVTHLSEADVSVDAIKKVATQLTMRS